MAKPSNTARLPMQRLAAATALGCGVLLTACGGGGGDSPATSTTPLLSQSDATAYAANASSSGESTAAAVDSVIDTTAGLAIPVAQPGAAASSDRMQALAAPLSLPVSGVTVDCAGGGTATLSITGGTLSSQLNGQLDAGEHYSVTFAQCSGGAGHAQLNGGVEMDVVSADRSTSPQTLAVSLTVTHLTLTLPSGSATLAGSASASRSVVTTNGTTTTTSHVTVPSATLATAFNGRNATFTLSDLDATRTVTSVGGVTTGSQYSGHHTLTGTADGRTISLNFATNGNANYDAGGALVSGAWTAVRPNDTIAVTVANGIVVMTVDDGNDGTIDHTWTFTTAQLNAAAG